MRFDNIFPLASFFSIESYSGNSHVGDNLFRYILRHSRKTYRFALNARKKIPAPIKFEASIHVEIHASGNIYFWAFTWSPANTDLTKILLPFEHLCHIMLNLFCWDRKNAVKTAGYKNRSFILLDFFLYRDFLTDFLNFL